jgi:hypothetical protein
MAVAICSKFDCSYVAIGIAASGTVSEQLKAKLERGTISTIAARKPNSALYIAVGEQTLRGVKENIFERCASLTTIPPPSFSNHRRSGIHDAPII